jgi:hypothetical protein
MFEGVDIQLTLSDLDGILGSRALTNLHTMVCRSMHFFPESECLVVIQTFALY